MPRASLSAPKPRNYDKIIKSGAPKGSFRGIKFASAFDRAQFMAWLAKLEQRRAWLRTPVLPESDKKAGTLTNKFVNSTFPWTIHQYPGKTVMLAWIVGVEPRTADNYLRIGLSKPAAVRAAGWARAKAAELLAIAEELERGEKPPP